MTLRIFKFYLETREIKCGFNIFVNDITFFVTARYVTSYMKNLRGDQLKIGLCAASVKNGATKLALPMKDKQLSYATSVCKVISTIATIPGHCSFCPGPGSALPGLPGQSEKLQCFSFLKIMYVFCCCNINIMFQS